jgi:transposase
MQKIAKFDHKLTNCHFIKEEIIKKFIYRTLERLKEIGSAKYKKPKGRPPRVMPPKVIKSCDKKPKMFQK